MKIDRARLHEMFNAIIKGDELEFNKFYSEYNKLIHSIAFSILKNEDESNDVTQIVFMKIWNMDKTKLPTKNEASWIYSLTKNETINYLRDKKDTAVSPENLYEISQEDKEIDEIIDRDKYNRIIEKLNKEEREIVSLKIISGFSFKEISQMLKIPIGTVQWKYYKSINTLKKIIANISMFIITIGLYLRRTLFSKNLNKENGVDEEENVIEENIENQLEEKNMQQDSSGASETSKQESLDNIFDGIENGSKSSVPFDPKQENIIVEDKKEIVNGNHSNAVIDNILIVLAIFFLIITIILSKFFIKNQQNGKKKASK